MAETRTPDEKLVDEFMARFEWAYQKAFPHFERMERINNQYNNKINSYQWPTISEIAFPLTFMAVEEQLPWAMEYLFPKKRGIRLVPEQHALPADRLKRVEDNLRYTLMTEMELKRLMLLSVKDCYRHAVGYALIDPEAVTPPSVAINELYLDGQKLEATRQMVRGQPKLVPTFRYMPVICVIPMPDGADVDGPNRASGHFVIDFKTEDEFRDMYVPVETAEGKKPLYKGDVQKIIDEARNQNFDSRMPPANLIKALAHLDLATTNSGQKKMPIVVPIVRCYTDHEQLWIANGRTLMWHKKDSFQTLRSNLVKFSAWPDGKEWFPLGVTEASERVAFGTNIWYNAMIDLAMYHMNPTRVINESMMDTNKSLARGPKADLKTHGDVRQAVTYLELPQMGQELFQLGAILDQMHGKANAQQPTAFSSPGLVRGGANALETLIQSSTGRQLLAGCVLKTGGYKATVEKTLILKQMLVGEPGDTIVLENINPVTGETDYMEVTTSMEDFRNTFRVELNFPEARWNTAVSMSNRAAYFDRCEKHPELFDTRARYEELGDDDDMVRRTMLPDAVVKERQERMAQARMAAAERGELEEEAGTEATQGQQALAGAAAMGGVQ